jgi:hypothetical protein
MVPSMWTTRSTWSSGFMGVHTAQSGSCTVMFVATLCLVAQRSAPMQCPPLFVGFRYTVEVRYVHHVTRVLAADGPSNW